MAERIFVREVTAEDYALSQERKRLREAPRVIKAKDLPWKAGPQHWNKPLLTPHTGVTQSLFVHVEEFAPGSRSKKHGHQNEAMFYILDGCGYDIHDGARYDWKAGDICIVHNDSVHQHINASPDKPARALVIKSKPLYMFLNLLYQARVEKGSEGDIGYRPRD